MIEIKQVDLQALLICSVRYSLRRRTYVVGQICRIVRENLSNIDELNKIVIAKNIREHLLSLDIKEYGIDEKEWANLLQDIQYSLEQNK